MAENAAPLTEEEVEARLAAADGVLGAAGHRVTDPVVRDIVRRNIRGEISDEEADHLILVHNGIAREEARDARPHAGIAPGALQAGEGDHS